MYIPPFLIECDCG